jgi:hypothetical protein
MTGLSKVFGIPRIGYVLVELWCIKVVMIPFGVRVFLDRGSMATLIDHFNILSIGHIQTIPLMPRPSSARQSTAVAGGGSSGSHACCYLQHPLQPRNRPRAAATSIVR